MRMAYRLYLQLCCECRSKWAAGVRGNAAAGARRANDRRIRDRRRVQRG